MRLFLYDLQPGQTYYLQARSVRGGEKSEWSPRITINTIVDGVRPLPPSSVSWTAIDDSFYAEWDSVTTNTNSEAINIVRYEVELTSGGVTAVRSVAQVTGARASYSLSFADNQAIFGDPKPTITFRVRAVDNKDLKSDWSPPVTASNPVPDPVSNLTVTPGTSLLSIYWTASPSNDVTNYNVYAGGTANFVPALGNRVWSGNATSATYYTTTYNLTYIKVRAVDKFNQESVDATASGTPTPPFGSDTTPPAVPTGVSAILTTSGDASVTYADVSWTANTEPDLSGYRVRYRKTGDSNWSEVNVGHDSTTTRIGGLIAYSDYQFQVSAYDFTNNNSAYSAIVVALGAANNAPSQPAAPTVASSTMQIQVVVSGNKAAGGAMESDVDHYEIYASPTTGFTPAVANMLGVVTAGPAMAEAFPIPATGGAATQTWYVKIIAVDRGALRSPASAQATANPNLISAVNIVDASITNAKIQNLDASKLTANSAFINDLNVNSTFTIGSANSDGALKSYDYVTGVSGYRLTKNTLEINSGTISAAALRIQQGQNIMTPQYSDFEANPAYYLNGGVFLSQGLAAFSITSGRFNTQSLCSTWASANSVNPIVYLAKSATDYNVQMEAGANFIVSAYAWCSGSVATNFQLKIRWSDGTVSTVGTATLASGSSPATATRISGVVTAPTNTGLVYIESSTLTANGRWSIDGVQVERQWTALTTPSPWKPPSTTTIDGAMITTGAIRSNQPSTLFLPDSDLTIQDPASTHFAWEINTQGAASFGNVQVYGSIVVGITDSYANTASHPAIASANYQPGEDGTGWIIRGNGDAEFRQVVANSLDGSAIRAGTLDANSISAGSVLTQDIDVTGGFSVIGSPTLINIGTTSGSTTITTSVDTFTAADVNRTIVSTSLLPSTNIVTVNSTTQATISVPAVETNAVATATLYRGRQITTSASGGFVVSAGGNEEPILNIPTDITQPVSFTGVLNAEALTVYDNFAMRGGNNSMVQSSTLTLNDNLAAPNNVAYTDGYDNRFWWYDVATNPYFYGFHWDAANSRYITMRWGEDHVASRLLSDANGGFIAEDVIPFNGSGIQETNPFYPAGGVIVTNDGFMWVLGRDLASGEWYVYQYTNPAPGQPPIRYGGLVYNRGWLNWTKLVSKPVLGTDGTNLFIARPNSAGKIYISKYTTATGVWTDSATNVTSQVDMKSLLVGNFDLGASGTTYYVITTANKTNHVLNSSFVEQVNRSWPTPLGWYSNGLAWNGSIFQTLCSTGRICDHTRIGDNIASTSYFWVRASWFDSDGAGTGQHESSTSSSFKYKPARRSRTRFIVPRVPDLGFSDDPDSAKFWTAIGTSSTTSPATTAYVLQTPSMSSNPQTYYFTTIATSGQVLPTTLPPFPAGTPSRIIDANGRMELSAAGTLILGSSANASTASGNKPALRLGPTTGSHIRMDGDSIIKMNNDTTQGTLVLNPGGSTYVNGTLVTQSPMGKNSANGAQSIPEAVWTVVGLANDYQRGDLVPSSSGFLVATGGYYALAGNIAWTDASSTLGRRIVRIERYSTQTAGTGLVVATSEASPTNGGSSQSVAGMSYFAAGDRVRLIAYQTSGGSLSTLATPTATLAMWFV